MTTGAVSMRCAEWRARRGTWGTAIPLGRRWRFGETDQQLPNYVLGGSRKERERERERGRERWIERLLVEEERRV
jgi:hypothetical protein